MKCPNCGEEIANDSLFCEFCGTKLSVNKEKSDNQQTERLNENRLKVNDDKVVKSSFVVLFMFLVFAFSIAELYCNSCLTLGSRYIYENAFLNTLLCVCLMNLFVFVSSILLVTRKKIRKSSSIALCLLSATIFMCSFLEYLLSYYDDPFIHSPYIAEGGSTDAALIIGGIYSIYLFIAKRKNIKF